MATITLVTRPSNGVSFGYKHVVLAAEAGTATVFLFDFQCPTYDIVADIKLITVTTGAEKALTGSKKTYPANGQVQLDLAGVITASTGDIIEVLAQRNVGDTPLTVIGFGTVLGPEFTSGLELFPVVEGGNPLLVPSVEQALGNVRVTQPVNTYTGDTVVTAPTHPLTTPTAEEYIEGTELVSPGTEGPKL